MNLDLSYDWGFSAVSEEEMKEGERRLAIQLSDTENSYKEKLEGVVTMVLPLLDGLMKDPDKIYIHWPNRIDKIKNFKIKLMNYVGLK